MMRKTQIELDEKYSLVLDSSQAFGDDSFWQILCDEGGYPLSVGSAVLVAESFEIEEGQVIESTLKVAQTLCGLALEGMESCGGIDDNYKDMYQAGKSLEYEVERMLELL